MLFQSIFCCFSGNSNIIFISGFNKQNIQGRYKQKSYLIIEVAFVGPPGPDASGEPSTFNGFYNVGPPGPDASGEPGIFNDLEIYL